LGTSLADKPELLVGDSVRLVMESKPAPKSMKSLAAKVRRLLAAGAVGHCADEFCKGIADWIGFWAELISA